MTKRRLTALISLLLTAVLALYLSGGDSEPTSVDAVRSWPIPSEAQIQRLKAEPNLKATTAELRNMNSATVVRVVDGDTVRLQISKNEESVRLLNIDTPETVDPLRPIQEYGREASDFLKSLLKPGTTVLYQYDVEKRDRYDRLLVHLYVEDGTWINALMIRAGYAQVLTISPNVRAAELFKELQRKARDENIGLWQISSYRK